jgi:ribosomal peptide maturation radical SAM protein 1
MDAGFVFVVMPFAERTSPALGVSLLKSTLAARGIRSRVLYPLLPFAALLGARRYDDITSQFETTDLVGEWLFAHGLRELSERERAEYRDGVLGRCAARASDALDAALPLVIPFVESCVERVLEEGPAVVGFTSSFQQHVPSLAVAAGLRARAPSLPIVFGGANCEGEMGAETLRRFPFVDAVVSGEAEAIVCELFERLAGGVDAGDLPGVTTRAGLLGGASLAPNVPPLANLDGLPYPDFSDYFEQLERHDETRCDERLCLRFETSRGCWWGAKSHCTFCGLNGGAMQFRRKSPDRALAEIEHLAAAYPTRKLAATDNILDWRYLGSVLPELARRGSRVELFYEVKANLRKSDVRLLHDAGVVAIQPGIESLSTPVLSLMRKGVTALQNVQTLKWCQAFGVHASWNLIYGFPGESEAHYEAMAAIVPLLSHLTPPANVGPVRLDRFSPYFEHPGAFGMLEVEPYPAYAHVYGLPPEALAKLAYYFTFRYADGRDPASYARGLIDAVAAWRDVHANSDLTLIDDGAAALVCDYRPVAVAPLTVLEGLDRALYLACDAIRSIEQLRAEPFPESAGATREQIEASLQRLLARRLMLREEGSFLSLAVPLEKYASAAMLARLGAARGAFG